MIVELLLSVAMVTAPATRAITPPPIDVAPTATQELINDPAFAVGNECGKVTHDYLHWDGPVLSTGNGMVTGPSGRESYYNLDMRTCVCVMRGMGYDEKNYPYYIRDDGCKMLGPYIMIAADYSIRPRGTVVPTSRGLGIVVDTGGFVKRDSTQIDMAVNW